MRAYKVGLNRVEVYEPTEARPAHAVAVASDGEIVCYVGPLDGNDAERCMTEAAKRHIRLKMAGDPAAASERAAAARLWSPLGLDAALRRGLFDRVAAR